VYLVGSCIGEGGMARIYQAEHAGLRRQVALKVLIDGFARDADGRERFLREARIAAAIKHPNVVNIFDVGVQDDIPYLVMELLEGKDLERLLEAKGSIDEGMIIDIMVPVVAGLIAVHDAGIVHRDLKPGNIFLARGRYEDFEPKLLDFGISKAPGPEQLKLTTNRTLMGTPFYISPEGMRGGEMTPLSDQYSLGVVMYECATGCTPFTGTNFSDLSKLITSGQYTPLSTRNPELSKRLSRIIERAMNLDPEKRFKDLRELGRELLTLAGQRTRITWGLTFGDAKPTLPSRPGAYIAGGGSASSPPPRWRRPRGLALAAIAPVLLAGIGLFALLSRNPDPGANPPLAPANVSIGRTEADHEPGAPSGGVPGPFMAPGAINGRLETEPAAAPASITKNNAPVGRPTRNVVDQAAARRIQRAGPPTNPRPSTVPAEAEPEWALPPPTNVSPGPLKSGIYGANGAPIFD
jgi:hypothetical protein